MLIVWINGGPEGDGKLDFATATAARRLGHRRICTGDLSGPFFVPEGIKRRSRPEPSLSHRSCARKLVFVFIVDGAWRLLTTPPPRVCSISSGLLQRSGRLRSGQRI